MDDTDQKLAVLLATEPRMHFHELARRLGISKQAAQHRFSAMRQAGVLKRAYASVAVSYLNAVAVCVAGRSRTASAEKTLDRLGAGELTRRAIVAGGSYFYVVGYLRDISELDNFAEFVKRTAEMPEPFVGMYCYDDGLMNNYYVDGTARREDGYTELTPLDLRIIVSLQDDARKSIAAIAKEIGASAKTVSRHLADMISEGSLEFSKPQDAALGGVMFLIIHVYLKDGVDRREVGRRLLSRCPTQDAYIRIFSNLPSLLIMAVWSDDMPAIRSFVRETGECEDVAGVMLNFPYLERIYTTWLDKWPAVQARSLKKPGTKNPLPGSAER